MANLYKTPTLIPDEYIKLHSPIPNNYNMEEVRPFVSIAESVWILPVIGQPLYDELIEQVAANEVTDVNSTLLLKIYPFEAMAIFYEYLPFARSHVNEKSITLGKSDNSDSIDVKDLSDLENHIKAQLTVLSKQLKDFLDRNLDCYPLYLVENDCCINKLRGEVRLYTNNKKKRNRNF